MVKLAPSLERADWLNLETEVKQLEHAGIDLIHVDIMDRTYGNTILFSPKIVVELKRITKLPLDIHLYVNGPEYYFPQLFEYCAGDFINIEIEAIHNISSLLEQIRDAGCRPAVTLDVGTPVCVLEEIIDQAELINVLIRNPNMSQKPLSKRILNKISTIKDLCVNRGRSNILLEADGSVNYNDIPLLVARGIDVLVLGSKTIFAKQTTYIENCRKLRAVADRAAVE